jgi:outer membrane protein insertion porin family
MFVTAAVALAVGGLTVPAGAQALSPLAGLPSPFQATPPPVAAPTPPAGQAGAAPGAPAAEDVQPCPAPVRQPPADSPPLTACVQFVFHPVNQSVIDVATYSYYLKEPYSQPSQDKWVPYKEDAVQADFWNLWHTGFLDNLWVEVIDEPYANGVMGKHVVFHMEERSRVKQVDYEPAKSDEKLKVDVSKIEQALKDKGIQINLDSFVDQATIRRVQGTIRDLYAEKGYEGAVVTPQLTPLAGGTKLVRLTFTIDSGPEFKIRQIIFDGNHAFSDGDLVGQMKDNKPQSWLSFITDAGKYQAAKFADDADKVLAFYQSHGYARARIGDPQLEVMEDSSDGDTRWIRLRIPVDEGEQYRVGKFDITGNKTIRTEYLRSVFKLEPGDVYDADKISKGMEKAREAYGTYGFVDLAMTPDLSFRGIDPNTGKPVGPTPPPPIVDVTMQFNEGPQYFVHRITFLGNTTTHDTVIRRELRIAEGGVFNTEALKDSVRRLNQLGYFKPLEKSDDIQIVPTPGMSGQMDVKLKFQEQNRNQISFGAGVSQYDGFFGQLSFQTANFLGRGETVGISLQKGSQAKNYQLSFSEPYLFDRPMTVGVDLYTRQYIYPLQYTQDESGGDMLFGVPVADYTRLYLGYSYERVDVPQNLINPSYLDPSVLNSSPYLRDALLINEGGHRTVSKISPSLVFNTVNAPIFPDSGTRYTIAFDLAGVGGDTSYYLGRLEGIWYKKFTARTSVGFRAQAQYIRPYGSTTTLPIFEKFFLGGEYSIRGYDIRSVGPRDPVSELVIGGNKSLLFNAEYYINIMSQARLVAFYDAGQAPNTGQPFAMNQFRTSTGLELRFFMPVLNVPFRLIAAYNPQRAGVLDNNLVLTKRFTFRFAVGTTF